MPPTRLYFVSDRRGVQMTPEVRFVGSPYAQFGCYSTQYLHIFNQKKSGQSTTPSDAQRTCEGIEKFCLQIRRGC